MVVSCFRHNCKLSLYIIIHVNMPKKRVCIHLENTNWTVHNILNKYDLQSSHENEMILSDAITTLQKKCSDCIVWFYRLKYYFVKTSSNKFIKGMQTSHAFQNIKTSLYVFYVRQYRLLNVLDKRCFRH